MIISKAPADRLRQYGLIFIANYFKMGGGGPFTRVIASLADPEAIGINRFLEILDTDRASNNKIPQGAHTINPGEIEDRFQKLISSLKEKQKQSAR